MNKHLLRTRSVIALGRLWLALMLPVLFSVLAWSQEYTLTDLGTLGGSYSNAVAVNNAGQVVGSAYVTGGGYYDPFLYSNGTMTDVGVGGSQFGGIAVAINNSGHFVVNMNYDAFYGDNWSYLWDTASWHDLGTGGATGMNGSDMVVGNSSDWTYWVYANGQLESSPGYPVGTGTLAYGINDAGSIVGQCQDVLAPHGGANGCVFGPLGTVVLGDAGYGAGESFPPYPEYAIASGGETCGINGQSQFALWSGTGAETYAKTVGFEAPCEGLDDYGDAVGIGTPNNAPIWHGEVYDPVNKLRDINKLIPQIVRKGHGVTIVMAVSISDTGFIAANCDFEDGGETHACLLTPNWSLILKDNIVALTKGDPECIQCKSELEPEGNSLPSTFAGLTIAEKKKAAATVEEITSRLRALRDRSQINEQGYVLLAHDTQMALQALGVPRG